MTTVAVNIATIRSRWDMNQSTFAMLLDASRPQVSNWERGHTPPPTPILLRLQSMTGISVHRLHTEELTRESLPPAPIEDEETPVGEHPILQEIRRVHSRLDGIEALLQRLIATNDL